LAAIQAWAIRMAHELAAVKGTRFWNAWRSEAGVGD